MSSGVGQASVIVGTIPLMLAAGLHAVTTVFGVAPTPSPAAPA